MFNAVKAAGRLELVAMNHAKYLHFTTKKPGIGTEKLNACTAVVIASPTAAILGHISPRPEDAPDDMAAGDKHIQAKLEEIFALLTEYHHDFPRDGSAGLVAYAIYNGAVGMPSQKTIIENHFQRWGIPLKGVEYDVMEGDDLDLSGKGTVMILQQSSKVFLWVEDKAQGTLPV